MWYRNALSCIDDAVIMTDRRGCIDLANPAAMAITGWPSPPIGQALASVLHVLDAETRKPITDLHETILRDGVLGEELTELLVVACNGNEVPVVVRGRRIEDEEGIVDGTVLVLHDVAQERQVLRAVAESEARYHGIFSTAGDAILLLDATTGCIVDVNPAMTLLLERTHAQLIGKQLWELGLYLDQVTTQAAFHELYEFGGTCCLTPNWEALRSVPQPATLLATLHLVGSELLIQCVVRTPASPTVSDACGLSASSAQPIEMEQAVEVKAGSPSLRILVVDDFQDSADMSALLLRLLGHEVFVAYSGKAALELIEQAPPDVLVADIVMPEMSGYELAEQVRMREDCRGMHMIALTGLDWASDRARSAEAGFDLHLVKPPTCELFQEHLAMLAAGSVKMAPMREPSARGQFANAVRRTIEVTAAIPRESEQRQTENLGQIDGQ